MVHVGAKHCKEAGRVVLYLVRERSESWEMVVILGRGRHYSVHHTQHMVKILKETLARCFPVFHAEYRT